MRALVRSYKGLIQPKSLERLTIQGDSPVGDVLNSPLLPAYQSSIEPVELGVKLGGPPSKAKYYITTDSEEVARAKDEKYPYKGS